MGVNSRGSPRSTTATDSHNAGARKSRIENGFTPLILVSNRAGHSSWRQGCDVDHRAGRKPGRRPPGGLEADRELFGAGQRGALRGGEHQVLRRRWSAAGPATPGCPAPAGSTTRVPCRLERMRGQDLHAQLLVVAEQLDPPVDSLRIGCDRCPLRGNELRLTQCEVDRRRPAAPRQRCASQRTAERRRACASSSRLSMPATRPGGRRDFLQRRLQSQQASLPSRSPLPDLRRHQPALETPARTAAQRAEHVFRRQAVDQLAVARLHAVCLSPDRHSLRLMQSAAYPALDAAQRVGRQPRDLVVRVALDERQRQALARVLEQAPDAVVEVVRLFEGAAVRPWIRPRPRRARRPRPGSGVRGASGRWRNNARW